MTKNSLQALYCTTATAFEHSAHTLTNRASPTATGILAPTSFYSSIDLRRSRLHVGLANMGHSIGTWLRQQQEGH